MKSRLINYLQRFAYPQKEFAKSIIPFLNKDKDTILVDAPCGNGVTSWVFSKLKNLKVYGYDLNDAAVEKAKSCFADDNLFFDTADIIKVIENQKGVNYFCIINSLFLLPQPEVILQKIKLSLNPTGTLFIIVPNIQSSNFKWFQQHNEGVNKLLLNKADLSSYFSSHGWKTERILPIVYTRIYGRKDLKIFSVFSPIYLRILNYLQQLFRFGTPSYFTLVLKKAGE